MNILRDILFLFFLTTTPAPGVDAQSAFQPAQVTACGGALTQGGLIVCNGPEGTRFTHNGVTLTAQDDGQVTFGLRRNADAVETVTARRIGAEQQIFELPILPRKDDYRVIEGMDCDKVDARTPEQKAHAARAWQTKVEGFARFHDGPGASQGFRLPAEGRPTSPFGPTRKYVGVGSDGQPCDKTSVHRGYDMATPVGTPVIAPAAGTIILADTDLYYEGGAVFMDHGKGLTSIFMHLSAVDVEVGDVVEAGDLIAKTGNTGRTTGPHLHWAVKWRNTAASDRGGDFYIDPALMLDLPMTVSAE